MVQCQLHSNLKLHLTMARNERKEFVHALASDKRVVARALKAFDARTANASVESDRQMIFGLIRDGFGGEGRDPFEHFNECVHKVMAKALAVASWTVAPTPTAGAGGSRPPSPEKGDVGKAGQSRADSRGSSYWLQKQSSRRSST